MKSTHFISIVLYAIFAAILLSSCSSDEEITPGDANETLVKEARSFLTGDIVLNTKATMSGVDKTLLPTGCPTKFKFQWLSLIHI